MSDRQIELVWACPCGHKSLGRNLACESCGRPKDENVEYEMPARPEDVASVTDAALLRMATAGENWSCAYCQSNQRALDGSCARCGAGRSEAATVAHAKSRASAAQNAARLEDVPPRRPRRAAALPMGRAFIAAAAILFGLGTCAYIVTAKHRGSPASIQAVAVSAPVAEMPVETNLIVTHAHWSRTTAVDRMSLVARECFTDAVPTDAVDVTAAGQRVHHQDRVLDHDDTVYDSVSVPDGTRTESYTERVACGQSCTTSPRSCHQVCKNNKNGFASCHDECTGGNQSCTTRYCDEPRTRQVAKTRTESRPRLVPVYRDEPRYAAWSTYRAWDWVEVSTATLDGEGTTPTWPEAGAAANPPTATNLAPPTKSPINPSPPTTAAYHAMPDAGAQTRTRQTEAFEVTLADDKGAACIYIPTSAEDFAAYAIGSSHRMGVLAGRATPR